MTFKFNRWPCKTIWHLSMLCQALFIILKQSVNSNWSYKPETANLGQNQWFFLPHVNLKFHGQPWKTIGHLFYVASSFVHHFIPISEFKLELQSRNTQFGSKSMIFFFFFFLSSVTKFDRLRWQERCEKSGNRRPDRRTEVFLELLGCS